MKFNEKIQKMCCFYASDWHLTIMLLPYINNKIEEKSSIYMRCENSIEDKMQTLLNKLEIKNKNNIEKINWNNIVCEDYNVNENEKIFIVSGDKEYIEENNKRIEDFFRKKKVNIKIINCYEVNENNNLSEIVKMNGYEKMINTKGEVSIKELQND